jgi:hypothetical protein
MIELLKFEFHQEGVHMKVKVKDRINYCVNDRIYEADTILDVKELWGFKDSYAYYYSKRVEEEGRIIEVPMLDWIPKHMVEIISDYI